MVDTGEKEAVQPQTGRARFRVGRERTGIAVRGRGVGRVIDAPKDQGQQEREERQGIGRRCRRRPMPIVSSSLSVDLRLIGRVGNGVTPLFGHDDSSVDLRVLG